MVVIKLSVIIQYKTVMLLILIKQCIVCLNQKIQ